MSSVQKLALLFCVHCLRLSANPAVERRFAVRYSKTSCHHGTHQIASESTWKPRIDSTWCGLVGMYPSLPLPIFDAVSLRLVSVSSAYSFPHSLQCIRAVFAVACSSTTPFVLSITSYLMQSQPKGCSTPQSHRQPNDARSVFIHSRHRSSPPSCLPSSSIRPPTPACET